MDLSKGTERKGKMKIKQFIIVVEMKDKQTFFTSAKNGVQAHKQYEFFNNADYVRYLKVYEFNGEGYNCIVDESKHRIGFYEED